MALFNQLYQIKGLHADMVRKITDVTGCRNIDVFYISLVLGLWQGRSVEPDNESKIEPAKIDPEQMIRYGQDIEYLYELVMMNDKSSSISLKERVDKAFKIKGTDKAEKDEARFTSIMLGGLEFLYNNVIENTTSKEDIFNNICELIQTYLVAHPEKE
jgi:hypothetical protein